MRSMNLVLAMAAAQLCTFGTIATLLAGCTEENRNPAESDGDSGGNRVPTISNMTVTPDRIFVGGTASIMAQAIDPDGDRITWRLGVNTDAMSPVAGRFDPTSGSGGSISSTFTASGPGLSSIVLTVTDDRSGIAMAFHPFTVFPRE